MRKQEYVARIAKEKEEQEAAQKQAPTTKNTASSIATSSPAAMQECYLAVEKINKIRPNWLATSYGECRSANQCSTQKCQDEIMRKQEYVAHSEKEVLDQSSARSMGVLMRVAAKKDSLSVNLNYIAGYDLAASKAFFYPLDLRDKKSACKVGYFDQSTGLIEISEIDLGKLNPKTLNIDTSFDRDTKGFRTIFTSTISGLQIPLICKDCTQARLDKSWQSILSLCDSTK
jgi:hypothetical protein